MSQGHGLLSGGVEIIESATPRVDRASRLISAPSNWVYEALVNPAMLVQWLPPAGVRATIDRFDPRPGGEFGMTLVFEAMTPGGGKTTSNTDVVKGWFVGLEPDRRISQCLTFEAVDPAFAGTMTMTWALAPVRGATMVTVMADNVPSGIRPEDHQAGMASSLANLEALARRNGFSA